MRLGEILIAAGIISPPQLAQALQRQAAKPKDRLGGHIALLGFATSDQVALALAKQLNVSAALLHHFEEHDPAVAKLIGPKIAADHSLLPIAFSRSGGRKLVICFRDPKQPELITKLSKAVGVPVTACVASEITISHYLKNYYGARAQFGTPPPPPSAQIPSARAAINSGNFGGGQPGLGNMQLVDLDHRDVAKAAPQVFIPESQRRSALHAAVPQPAAPVLPAAPVPTPIPTPAPIQGTAPPPAAEMASASIGATTHTISDMGPTPAQSAAPSPVAAATVLERPIKKIERQSLAQLLEEIEHADKRSVVSDSIMSFLRQRFSAGMMFTIKDGLAMGHRGFGGHLDDKDIVTALMLPLNKGILGSAHNSRELWRGDPSQNSSVAQDRFLNLFNSETAPTDVVVAPIAVGSRVLCLIYAHGAEGLDLEDPKVDELEEIADATTHAFTRLIQQSRKPKPG